MSHACTNLDQIVVGILRIVADKFDSNAVLHANKVSTTSSGGVESHAGISIGKPCCGKTKIVFSRDSQSAYLLKKLISTGIISVFSVLAAMGFLVDFLWAVNTPIASWHFHVFEIVLTVIRVVIVLVTVILAPMCRHFGTMIQTIESCHIVANKPLPCRLGEQRHSPASTEMGTICCCQIKD